MATDRNTVTHNINIDAGRVENFSFIMRDYPPITTQKMKNAGVLNASADALKGRSD